jgi:hypothetical protein
MRKTPTSGEIGWLTEVNTVVDQSNPSLALSRGYVNNVCFFVCDFSLYSTIFQLYDDGQFLLVAERAQIRYTMYLGKTTDLPQVNWQKFLHSHIGPSRIRTDAGWRREASWYKTDVLTNSQIIVPRIVNFWLLLFFVPLKKIIHIKSIADERLESLGLSLALRTIEKGFITPYLRIETKYIRNHSTYWWKIVLAVEFYIRKFNVEVMPISWKIQSLY